MRTLAILAIAVGAGALLRTAISQRAPTFDERYRQARAKCRGRLHYDAALDMFFDMSGRVGTAIT